MFNDNIKDLLQLIFIGAIWFVLLTNGNLISDIFLQLTNDDVQTYISINYATNPKEIQLNYIVDGRNGKLNIISYKGLNDFLAAEPRSYYCYNGNCPSNRDIELKYIDESNQSIELRKIVKIIEENYPNEKSNQARMAISLVQNIPYDYAGFQSGNLNNKFPYEVIYSNAGVCGEKSRLLAFLLKELGFGVVLFSFPQQNHMAVGIKCSNEYSYGSTGYCFVESTAPTIPTYYQEEYVNAGLLPDSPPEVISISDGFIFDAREEYLDAEEWHRLHGISLKSNGILNDSDYSTYVKLAKKYGFFGIEQSAAGTCPIGSIQCGDGCYKCFANHKVICKDENPTCTKFGVIKVKMN